MHCKVDGKLFAANTDRQKTDISFTLKAGLPGVTLDSCGILSGPVLPAYEVNEYHICHLACGKLHMKNSESSFS